MGCVWWGGVDWHNLVVVKNVGRGLRADDEAGQGGDAAQQHAPRHAQQAAHRQDEDGNQRRQTHGAQLDRAPQEHWRLTGDGQCSAATLE